MLRVPHGSMAHDPWHMALRVLHDAAPWHMMLHLNIQHSTTFISWCFVEATQATM
jgi:hypothetical protein